MINFYPEPKWIVEGMIPMGASIMAGKSKIGKSFLALGISIEVARGGLALGKIRVEQGDVLYLALDKDTERSIQGRLRNICGEEVPPERLWIATREIKWPKGKEGLLGIEHWIEDHPNARLIVIDTFAKFWPSSGDSSYNKDAGVLGEISDLAHKHDVAILVLHHFTQRKLDEGEDWTNQLQFTEGFVASADAVLGVFRKRGTDDAELKLTGNEIEDQEYGLRWDVSNFTWSLLGDVSDAGLSPARTAIVRWLKENASEERPATPKEVAIGVGTSHSTMKTNLIRMAEAGQIDTNGKGGYWKASKPLQLKFE